MKGLGQQGVGMAPQAEEALGSGGGLGSRQSSVVRVKRLGGGSRVGEGVLECVAGGSEGC